MDEKLNDMIILWYEKGHDDMEAGAEFNPPDHALLRIAYATGWECEIMGTSLSNEQLLKDVNG